MKKSFKEIYSLVGNLHQLPMTTLEKQLKRCLDLRPKLSSYVLSPEEMWRYMKWMIENFSSRSDFAFSEEDIPFMLADSKVSNIAKNLRESSSHTDSMEQFHEIYIDSKELDFFSENHSITASRLFRHMPAYWNSSDYFELYYAFSGDCPIWFSQESFLLKPGTLLLIPPATNRACRCPNDDSIMMVYKIRSSTFSQIFWRQLSDQNLMSLFFRKALIGENHTDYLAFDIQQDSDLELLLCAIYDEYTTDTSYSAEITNSLMSTFFLMLLQRYENAARLSENNSLHWKPEFTSIFNYIQNNYTTVTIEELALRFNYSNRHIIRIIQSCTGMNFNQVLLKIKMEKAVTLLLQNNLTIENISQHVGYSTVSSFYRAFVKYYGCTPIEYKRKKHIN